MNFEEILKSKTERAEAVLAQYLPKETGFQKKVLEAINYSVMAGGKRLRPILMEESFLLFHGEGKQIEPFMAALEMIHNYSLVHDDLPAMDNDEYRRGRKTTWKVYGDGMAVLAGDGLLNLAFETAGKAFEVIKKGMKGVVTEDGTASGVFKGFPIAVGGKTGSAQTREGRSAHGVFVSFAPYGDPEIAVCVVGEYAGSGGSMAPVCIDIYNKYFGLTTDEPQDGEADTEEVNNEQTNGQQG